MEIWGAFCESSVWYMFFLKVTALLCSISCNVEPCYNCNPMYISGIMSCYGYMMSIFHIWQRCTKLLLTMTRQTLLQLTNRCVVSRGVFLDPDSKVHGAHLGPTGPRWAPYWPHELHLGGQQRCLSGVFAPWLILPITPKGCLSSGLHNN